MGMNTKIKTGVPQKRRVFLRVWEPEDDDRGPIGAHRCGGGGRLRRVTAEALREVVAKVVRHAYSAHL